MAVMVKKTVKKLGGRGTIGGRGPGGGGDGGPKETSDLRPSYVPKTPPCIATCPNNTDIRGILTTIAQAEKKEIPREEAFRRGYEMLLERNPFPASCGRVCPHPCETACNRGVVDDPVHINGVERFLGDWGLRTGVPVPMVSEEKHADKKVAVIGSGPAGLSCAYQLARRGFPVTVYEAFPKAGGMMRYGIPSYRLPETTLDAEIGRILELGVELKLNTIVGKDVPYADLQKEHAAIFVGIGAHAGKKLGLPGEADAANVMTGAEFLHRINSGTPVAVGEAVIVVGGGNSAIDAARVSKRLGARVVLLYRRTRAEMPAIEEEIREAEIEGIEFVFLAAPRGLTLDGSGNVTGMTCQRMELGEPDASGRRRPVPVEGSTFELPCAFVIPAISQEPEFEALEDLREGRDWVKVDGRFHVINTDAAIWAGGDDLSLDLVTTAIGHGRRAAIAMADYLLAKGEATRFDEDRGPEVKAQGNPWFNVAYWEKALRHDTPFIPVEQRFGAGSMEREVSGTLSEEDALAECARCMSCGQCFQCDNCFKYCQDNAVKKPMDPAEPYHFKLEFCQGCKKCAENCPCGYIDLT
jgi:NADPH-dependent glutamate synthase beta subunit-like oxidoreductase/Pyruvate/2-oxoacid:ferredoxin oxidoreductase delta subunit